MTATGLAVFDRTLQETNAWLKIVMGDLKTDDRECAYAALKGTLRGCLAIVCRLHPFKPSRQPQCLKALSHRTFRPLRCWLCRRRSA